MFSNFKKILFLINSEGNKSNIKLIKKSLNESFQEQLKNDLLIVAETIDSNSTKQLSRDFSEKYDDSLIIAVGGDGTIHEIINSIDFENTSLAILPNGTGNDFATSLYKGKKIEEVLELMDTARFKKVDVVKINDLYSMNVTSFGYDTVILEKSLKIKKRCPSLKAASFKLAIPLTLHKIRPVSYDYVLRCDDGSVIKDSGSFILSAICNSSRFGGGFTPAPDALIDDGIIEVNQVDNLPLLKLLYYIPAYKDGRHAKELEVSHNYRVISGEIIPKDGKIKGNIDGELYEFERIDFKVIPKAINLMVID